MKEGYSVKCINISSVGDDAFFKHRLTLGKTYKVQSVNDIGEVRIIGDDGREFSFSPHRFEIVAKRLELKDLFIGKIVVADYSTPTVAWVCGLTVSPIGEVVAVIKRADDQREVPIHPNNLFEPN